MREFTRTLEAGQQDRIAAGGDYVYFKDGEGEVKLITDDGSDVILQVGQGVRFKNKFNTIDTQNINSEQATFVIMIGLGDFQNNRMVGKVEIDGVVEVKQTEVVEVKQTGVVDVKPAGGSVAVGAKKIGSLLPVKTYEQIPARENREKLLINYFNGHKKESDLVDLSVVFIVVKVDGVPLTFFAPYGESGSIEINTTKALEIEFFENKTTIEDNGGLEYNFNSFGINKSDSDYNKGNNNYTGSNIMLSIVEVLNDAAEP